MTKGPEPPRKPRAFEPDDPRLDAAPPPADDATDDAQATALPPEGPITLPTWHDARRGIGWAGVLMSTMVGLATLAAGVWFTRFVSVALARQDWVGWLATGMLALGLVAAAVITVREVLGLLRVGRLGRIRTEADRLVREPDLRRERALVRRIGDLLGGRGPAAWGVVRLRQHQQDVHDAGGLMRLADREVIAPIDREARRLVLASAKRVATVTALSPIAVATVLFVLIENLGLMRRLAGLYGGRPGVTGGFRLARLVIMHLIATGGVALTDDLIGQFIGQDLLRRVSARLGEGAFNGALTARVGVATLDIVRPLPFLDAPAVRVRDIVAELFRRLPASGPGGRE
jgi:putative membrane protein